MERSGVGWAVTSAAVKLLLQQLTVEERSASLLHGLMHAMHFSSDLLMHFYDDVLLEENLWGDGLDSTIF